MKEPKIKIQEAIDAVGSKSRLAELLGISRAAVTMWGYGGKQFIPALQAYRLKSLLPEKFSNDKAA